MNRGLILLEYLSGHMPSQPNIHDINNEQINIHTNSHLLQYWITYK